MTPLGECFDARRAVTRGKRRGSPRKAARRRLRVSSNRETTDRSVGRRWNTPFAQPPRKSSALAAARLEKEAPDYTKKKHRTIPIPSPGVPSSSSVARAGRSRRPTRGSRSSPRAAGRSRCCWRSCTSAREPRGESSGAGSPRRRERPGSPRIFQTRTRVSAGSPPWRTETRRARTSCREGSGRRSEPSSSARTSLRAGPLRKVSVERFRRVGDEAKAGKVRVATRPRRRLFRRRRRRRRRSCDAWCGVRGAAALVGTRC